MSRVGFPAIGMIMLLSVSACGGSSGTPTPTLKIAISPASAPAGQTAMLTWSSSDVSTCQASGAWAGGGQIDMPNSSSLEIYSNEIIDGQIDLNNATGQTWGIEIANQNTNVLITNNEVTNNVGAGIGADFGTTGTNFLITSNNIYNNDTNLFGLSGTGIRESGDCFTP